jgi:hypothetical protein
VIAIKKFISGFVSIQLSDNRLDRLRLRCKTTTPKATEMGSTAILN